MPQPTTFSADTGLQCHEEREIREVTQRMCEAFAASCGEDTVRDMVERSHQDFASARVRAFVPLLVEREVRRLLESAAAPGSLGRTAADGR